jgi:glutamate synthase (NADPH) small chain
MNAVTITIDGTLVTVSHGESVLAAARSAGLDIPTLCYLEKCGPLNSCLVCLVKINGKLVPSCGTRVEPGMVVESETEEVHEARRTALELLFSDHVGDCLSPCHRLCPLGLNIPAMIRHIETGTLEEAVKTVRGALPLAGVLGRLCHHPCEQGCRRGNWDDPAAIRDMERFVTDWEREQAAPGTPASLPAKLTPEDDTRDVGAPAARNEKTVVVIGAGPAGLSSAYYLARYGHRVTVVDRHDRAGGSLNKVPEAELPAAVIETEISALARLGVEFKLGVQLGEHVTIDGLSRGFDAILVTAGEPAADEREKLGLPLSGNLVKADPNTCRTPLPRVFAAGAAVKPVKQLVRAMAEGRAAAECVHRFLKGQPVRRPEKLFSSVMGRLDPGELRQFLANANMGGTVSPCDRCAGLNRKEAPVEAARCLHCDCRSSGNCVLQHYAQVYGADANRFRSERKKFEQYTQPGGVIFEPGKCILCGICVKLTELAREPLGLTFIGRGFDVRISAPFNHSIQDGLRKAAQECVRHCPTGALAFKDGKNSSVPVAGFSLLQ